VIPLYLWSTRARAIFLARGPRVHADTRPSLRPLFREGEMTGKARAKRVARMRFYACDGRRLKNSSPKISVRQVSPTGAVMAGLVPACPGHPRRAASKLDDVDARDKPGHDGGESIAQNNACSDGPGLRQAKAGTDNPGSNQACTAPHASWPGLSRPSTSRQREEGKPGMTAERTLRRTTPVVMRPAFAGTTR